MVVCALSASAGPPASDRHILYEPDRPLSWQIDGDYQTENGNLVLGGLQSIRFRAAKLEGDYFLFRMDYRASIEGPPQPTHKGVYYPDPQSGAVMLSMTGSRVAPGVTVEYKNYLSSASTGMGLTEASQSVDQWDRVILRGHRNPTTKNLEIVGWIGSAASSESDIMESRPSLQGMCDARRFGDLCINVPSGSHLMIREAVLEGDVASDAFDHAVMWFVFLLVCFVGIAAGGLIWRLRRRSSIAPETNSKA
jgi:hypothetical protein